jgi:PAS domain S-box-containing protein
MRVLIVEDDVIQGKLLKDVLESELVEAVLAPDGKRALELLEKQDVSCIVSDVIMPGMDGFMLVHKIRADKRFQNIPFIMYTSSDASIDDEQFAYCLGVNHYIRKPDKSQLVKQIKNLLKSGDVEVGRMRSGRDKWMVDKFGKLIVGKLDRSREDFQSAVERSSIVSRADKDGIISYVNQNFIAISGYDEHELLGSDHNIVNSHFHPRTFWAEMWKTISQGGIWRGEVKNRAKDGRFYWVDTFIMPLFDEDGRVKEFLSVRNDITSRKKVEEELTLRSYFLKKVQQVARIGHWTTEVGKQEKALTWSDETLRLFGLGEGEFDGNLETFMSMVHPADRDLLRVSGENAIYRDGIFDIDHRIITKNGALRWVHAQAELLKDEAGNPLRLIGVVQDITARKNTEMALQEFHQRYELLSQATNDAVWDLYLGLDLITWNHAIFDLLGYNENEIQHTGKWWSKKVHVEDFNRVETLVRNAIINKEKSFTSQHRFQCADGTYKNVYSRAYVLYDEQGNAVRMIGSMQDITQLKQAMDDLRLSDQRLASHLDNSPLAIIEWDKNFIVRQWSPQSEKFFGWTKSEVVGKHFNDFNLVFEEDVPSVVSVAGELMNGMVSRNVSVNKNLTKSGKVIFCQWYNSALKDETGNVISILSLIQDITKVKNFERSILSIAGELADLIENANVPIFGINMEGKVNEWNQTIASLTGHSKKHAVGASWSDVLFDSQAALEFSDVAEQVLNGSPASNVEFVLFPKGGSRVNLLVSGSPRRDSSQRITGAIFVAQNITELTDHRSNLEIKVQERTRELSEALNKEKEMVDMKSKFASIVSHEFRTPLSTIAITSGIIRKHHANFSATELNSHLDNIGKQINHMTYLLDDVLLTEKVSAGKIQIQCKEIEIHGFFTALCDEVQRSRENTHQIKLTENIKASTILSDEKLLRSIFINLLTNAIKFSPNGDHVDVLLSNSPTHLSVLIRDSGIGIPPEDIKNIFEPFFRGGNARAIQGTGLGLSIIKKSLDLLKGTINVSSVPGSGTDMIVTLPICYE